jgi:hypothetical protein
MHTGDETSTMMIPSPRRSPVDGPDASSESPKLKPIAKFLLDLKQVNIYIAIQAVLDALDIWLSAIKYVFDALNPSSGNKSTAQMYHWLATADGLLMLILGSVFFALFAFCGNYFDFKKNTSKHPIVQKFSKMADNYWPFLRDCFKGLKWTFKGTRSFLLVAQVIAQQNFVYLITPLGIGLGVLSAVNRAWNRGMVERRKVLQAENDAFRKHIKCINAGFVQVDEKWRDNFQDLSEELKSLYAGAVVRVRQKDGQDQYFYVTTQAQETGVFNQKAEAESYQLRPLDGLTEAESAFLQKLENDPLIQKTDYYHYKKKLALEGVDLENSRLGKILAIKANYLDHLDYNTLRNYPCFQKDARQAYASSLINGILNSPYYFLGVLSLVLNLIPASVFPFAVAFCSVFMVLNLIAELYQEFDYQRRLAISQTKAEIAMIKRLVSLEWDKINELFDACATAEAKKMAILSMIQQEEFLSWRQEVVENYLDTDLPLQTQVQAIYFDAGRQAALKQSLERLATYYKDFSAAKKQLEAHLVLENRATFMQGIKNGLHMYGVFNGCLMAVSTIAFLSGWTFGLPFFYASLAAGVLFTGFGIAFTVLLANRRSKAEKIKQQETVKPEIAEIPASEPAFWVPEKLPGFILNEQDISPTKNLMISEQCEVVRQFMSGSKKGVKLMQTLLMLAVGMSDEVPIPLKITYGAVALIYGGFFSLKGLRGLMRVDNQDYENSLLVGRFFPPAEPEDSLRRCTSQAFNTALVRPARP